MSAHPAAAARIPIGISSCLLGEEVRFDGGHKRDAYINGTLASYFEFVPVCPEVAIGMGVPRQPIRIVNRAGELRVVGVKDPDLDVTDPLTEYSRRTASGLGRLRGYIFKRGSPTCGMERVKVYTEKGHPLAQTSGVFARAFIEAHPLVPCEEEGRLGDPVLRENFIERVFVYDRWCRLREAGLTPGRLVDFHTAHKLLVLAHNQAAYRRMGRLVAEAGRRPLEDVAGEYAAELMAALRRKATPRSHANVLQHLMGYVSDRLDAADRAELVEVIASYRTGLVPLVVPITLLKHHFRRHPTPYVERQHYLSPHPQELMLRNLL